MRIECLNLIGDGAFLKYETKKENKNCENCKYMRLDDFNNPSCNCLKSPLLEQYTTFDFGCNKWEKAN